MRGRPGVLGRLLEADPSAGGGRAAAVDETGGGGGGPEPTDPEAHGDSLAEGELQGHPAASSTEPVVDKRTDGFSPHSWAWGRAWLVLGELGWRRGRCSGTSSGLWMLLPARAWACHPERGMSASEQN